MQKQISFPKIIPLLFLLLLQTVLHAFPIDDSKVFSPNADGIKDTVRFEMPLPGSWVEWEITILSANKSALRSFKGIADSDGVLRLVWDGCDSNGNVLSDGDYTYLVEYVDDSQAPVTSVSFNGFHIIRNGESLIRTNTKIILSASDQGKPLSGTDKTYYRTTTENFIEYTSPIKLQDGKDQLLYLKSVDKAGNEESVQTHSLTVDSTPPQPVNQLSFLKAENGLALFWKAFDDEDISHFKIHLNGSPLSETPSSPFLLPLKIPTDSLSIQISAIDYCSNESELSTPISYDSRETITISSPDEGSFYNGIIQISGSSTHFPLEWSYSDVKNPTAWTLFRKLDLLTDVDIIKGKQYSFSWNTSTLNGAYLLRALSATSNGITVENRPIKIDNQAPITEILINGKPLTQNEKIILTPQTKTCEISFTAVDPEVNGISAGIKETHYQVYGPLSSGAPLILKNPGNYKIIFYSEDSSLNSLGQGNIEQPRTNFLTIEDSTPPAPIDQDPPQIVVSGVIDGGHYNKSVSPTVNVSDNNLFTSSISLDGTPFTSGDKIDSEQVHRISVHAQDMAKNISIKEVGFTIDRTPPTLIVTGLLEGMTYSEVTPSVNISEPNLDSASVSIHLDGVPFIPGTTIIDEGTHILTVQASDLAGNSSYKKIQFNIRRPVSTNTLLFYSGFDNETLDADFSLGNPHATINGDVELQPGRVGGKSLTGDKISFSAKTNLNTTNGMILFWLKTSTNTNPGTLIPIFSISDQKGIQVQKTWELLQDHGKELVLRFRDKAGNIHQQTLDFSFGSSQQGEWRNIGISWDSKRGIIHAYSDGKNMKSWTNSPWIPSDAKTLEFNGTHPIDDLMIFNRPLTVDEIHNFANLVRLTNLESKGQSFLTAYLDVGNRYYADRNYILVTLIPELKGSLFLKTANDDKLRKQEENLLSFETLEDVEIYVGFDERIKKRPDWLTEKFVPFDKDGKPVRITTTDVGNSQMRLYKRSLLAGEQLSLGGNNALSEDTYHYIVIVSKKRLHSVKGDR